MSLIKKPSELAPKSTLSILIYGQPGTGKAQPLFSRVLTDSGFKEMGSINVGDTVMSVSGIPQKVVGVFPQGMRPVYKVETNDGAVALCDAEHIWTVRNSTGNSRKAGWRNMTLENMLSKGIMCPVSPSRKASNRKPIPRFEIPVMSPAEYTKKEYLIDPYILGVLLGDGSLVGDVVRFSNPDMDAWINEEVSRRLPEDYELSRYDGCSCPYYNIVLKDKIKGRGFIRLVDKLGLCVHSGEKFIPEEYFLGSVQQRLDLLRGLMDTDGSSHEGCKIYYSTTSAKLAGDIVELVRSLGGIATIAYYEREDKDSAEYAVRIKLNLCPFSLERKAKNWHESSISRYIVSAEYVGEFPCQCIKVSDDSELYITDEYIVTHNTSIACSAPNAVLFDYDGGVHRINPAHQIPTVQIESWEQTQEALAEIDAEMPECKTIIIDTVGKMLDYMSASIIRNDSRMGQRDGSLALKGYGVRKTMFVNFIKQLAVSGRNVVFVAHEKEDKNNDVVIKRPEVGGSSVNDLLKELDLVGYMQFIGKDRTIAFTPTEQYYAKDCLNLPEIIKVPKTIDDKGEAVGKNNFFDNVIKTYVEGQKERIKRNHDFENLIAGVKVKMDMVEDVDELNTLTSTLSDIDHIYNSKLVIGQMLNAKAKEIGAKWNAAKKEYVTA